MLQRNSLSEVKSHLEHVLPRLRRLKSHLEHVLPGFRRLKSHLEHVLPGLCVRQGDVDALVEPAADSLASTRQGRKQGNIRHKKANTMTAAR